MRSSRLFRRVIAGLCAAAMLCSGMAASAAAPALPAAPAAVEAINAAPSDAELKTAFSKFTVTYDEEAGGWDFSSPQEQASMDKKSCGLYPYMFLQDDSIAFNIILTYVGSKKPSKRSTYLLMTSCTPLPVMKSTAAATIRIWAAGSIWSYSS